jgi:hypothetical protein
MESRERFLPDDPSQRPTAKVRELKAYYQSFQNAGFKFGSFDSSYFQSFLVDGKYKSRSSPEASAVEIR